MLPTNDDSAQRSRNVVLWRIDGVGAQAEECILVLGRRVGRDESMDESGLTMTTMPVHDRSSMASWQPFFAYIWMQTPHQARLSMVTESE